MTRPADPKDIGRIIRCRNTNQYFTGNDWTDDPSKAQLFPNEDEAMRASVAHQLEDIDVVVWAPTTKTEVAATAAAQ